MHWQEEWEAAWQYRGRGESTWYYEAVDMSLIMGIGVRYHFQL